MSRSQSLNFKKLVEAHYASLHRFAFSLANDEQEACDLTQHTFFIYANKGSAIRDPSKIKSWLFATLHQEYLRQRSAPHVEPRANKTSAAADSAVLPETVTGLDGASAAALLQRIDETCRAPLALFYLHDLSYQEISGALGAPVATVLEQIARGKIQLKKILAERTRPA